jgi:hypothetical protein
VEYVLSPEYSYCQPLRRSISGELSIVSPEFPGLEPEDLAALRAHARTGRPLGAAPFVERLEKRLGRKLAKARPGPKPKSATRRRAN